MNMVIMYIFIVVELLIHISNIDSTYGDLNIVISLIKDVNYVNNFMVYNVVQNI
jgi:hypothetical protein